MRAPLIWIICLGIGFVGSRMAAPTSSTKEGPVEKQESRRAVTTDVRTSITLDELKAQWRESERQTERDALIMQAVRIDGGAFLAWLREIEGEDLSHALKSQVILCWGAVDRIAAWEECKLDQHGLNYDFLHEWSFESIEDASAAARDAGIDPEFLRRSTPRARSPEETLALGRAMAPGPERKRLLGEAMIHYPTDDPHKVLSLAEDLGTWDLDTRWKFGGSKGEALLMPTSGPPEMGFFNSGISGSDSFGSRIHDSVRVLAQESPREAMAWLAKIDVPHEHPVFQALLTETLGHWEAEEPEAMQAWKARFQIEVEETE